jgi:hypothetical protein
MPLWPIVCRLLAVSLPLYLAWELLQMPSFVGVSSDRIAQLGACLLATAADGLMMLALFGVGWALFRARNWYSPPRLPRYAGIALLGVGLVAVVDALALQWLRLWSYAAWHPTLFGIGVIALLQPVVLVPLSFGLLARWDAR